jgi:PPK2 family polyphosphate:nucleotide phosphotransferase
MQVDYHRYRVADADFRLKDLDPGDTQHFDGEGKDEVQEAVARNRTRLAALQEVLYAEGKQALLLVLQAMDGAGKDSTIRRITEGCNPTGFRIYSFKAPTDAERDRDFLWRVHQQVPPKGHIGIFNRSHYEDVLIVRVHGWAPKDLLARRYDHINAFEQLLLDHGTRIVKVMLHISKDYQREQMQERLMDPSKHWKFNPDDLKERALWDDYMDAYETALRRCSTAAAPWYAIPGEKRWFRDLCITQLLVDTLEDMNPQYPAPTFDPKEYPPASIR